MKMDRKLRASGLYNPKFTVKIVDLLQNIRDNVFAEITFADMSAHFAGNSTVGHFVPLCSSLLQAC